MIGCVRQAKPRAATIIGVMRVLRLISAAAVLLALGACSAPAVTPAPAASGSSSSVAAANQADVMFAQMMIPHHEQAVVMSDLVLAKQGLSTEVTALASAIKAAQQPEIDQMRGWLRSWGAAEGGEHAGHAGMSGMLTQEQLDALQQAQGVEAEKLFLSGMIGHHEGAVTMAKEAQGSGSHPEVQKLAAAIISSQQAEIDSMKLLLEQRS